MYSKGPLLAPLWLTQDPRILNEKSHVFVLMELSIQKENKTGKLHDLPAFPEIKEGSTHVKTFLYKVNIDTYMHFKCALCFQSTGGIIHHSKIYSVSAVSPAPEAQYSPL